MENYAIQMTDLTMRLFMNCQEREAYFVSLYGIKVAEFRCLRYLLQKDCISIKELAHQMKLTPSRLTRIIDDLFRRDLIVRSEDKTDRRSKIIELSEQGKRLAAKMEHHYIQMHKQILSQLPEHSRIQILQSIEQLIDAMDWWAENKEKNFGAEGNGVKQY